MNVITGSLRVLLVVLLTGACTGLATGSPPATSKAKAAWSADETLYLQRFARLRDRTGTSGLPAYDTLQPVTGSADDTALARHPDGPRVAQSAIDTAVAYAQQNKSSALLIWHDGYLEAAHYFGQATRETPLVSKSLAKPLAVVAVGRAIERGFIKSLDDPVADYILEWQGTPKAAITIRWLIGMRSGLLPQAPAETADDILNRAYLHPRHDEIIIAEYPLTHTPGSRYEYSNASIELVAPLIERATGVAYEDWVATEVLQPLGAAGGKVWMNRPGGTPHAGCCWLLPAETWLRLGILLLNDGVVGDRRLLPPNFVGAMRTPSELHPHAGLGLYIAGRYVRGRGPLSPDKPLGQTLHSEPYLADDLFLFDGNSNQVVYIVPSARLVVARFGAWPPRDPPWDNSLLANTVLRGLPARWQRKLVTQPSP